MNTILIYFLKVNIAIAMFYLFYRLFFANDTFWKTRRYYLLFSILISFIYPFFSIENWLQNQQSMQTFVANYSAMNEFTVITENTSTIMSVENVLFMMYGLVTMALFVRLGIRFFSILQIRRKGKSAILKGYSVIALENDVDTFSFFLNFYINPLLHSPAETDQILTHEFAHVRQKHSIDVLAAEILSIIFWFNPATWLLKREIRQNLEFLADNKVLESGFDTKLYQYHLLQISYQVSGLILTNKFNVSPLKKRITMMNQQKTTKTGILKYLLIAPLALALVISSNAETIISSTRASMQSNFEKPQKKTIKDVSIVSIKKEDPVFQVVEKMPVFQGGEQALFNYLGENIKYPATAQKKGIQGRVICQFIVTTDGSIDDVKVVRSVEPSLDAEALRVISAMPAWTPGQQNGENVNVQYTLPINFKLSNGKITEKNAEEVSTLINDNKVGGKPIIVVDGKEITDLQMNEINPESIKDVSILKDKAAISAYGEKGKNGVVLITLKN